MYKAIPPSKDHNALADRRRREKRGVAFRVFPDDLAARVDNIRADTRLKDANADKSMTEAASNAVEISETFNKAARIVSQAAELNEGGEITGEFEEAENGENERETDTEGNTEEQ